MNLSSVKTMNSDQPQNRSTDRLPERFACSFLKSHGAIIERAKDGYHAVLPEKLSSLLKVPDLIHFHTGQGASSGPDQPRSPFPDTPSWRIHYGSALLDKMLHLACRKIPFVTYDIHFDYIKSQGFDKLIKEQFVFFNAVGKTESQALIKTQYVMATCRYLAQSDEQKEGLTSLVFNLETGACVPGMADLIPGLNRTIRASSPAGGSDAPKLIQILEHAGKILQNTITEETADFRESMKRRFRRDAGNLRNYYRSLRDEMKKSLERQGLSKQLIAERRQKIDLIPAELKRKQDDLLKKYSIKIGVHPATLMQINTEAVKVLFRASIGKSTKTLSMIYNPVTKFMDPLVCQGCSFPTYRCTFCKRHHLLCPACAGRCPLCYP